MQMLAELPVGQQAQEQAQLAPILNTAFKNPDVYPPQLRDYLRETGDDGGCIYGRIYSSFVNQSEPGPPHAQKPILSQYLEGVLAALPGERQQSPPQLIENIERSEPAGRSTFGPTFESLHKTACLGIPQQHNKLHPSHDSAYSSEEHEDTPLMLQRYIDSEFGKDGGSVYARLFETLDTLKAAESLHKKRGGLRCHRCLLLGSLCDNFY
ncbi:hypothetical protein EV426DRAFT_702416 [Tirmania nivea]|nr:hypothetical protein EV426DRAFT_702416 [Tirmania nivea]